MTDFKIGQTVEIGKAIGRIVPGAFSGSPYGEFNYPDLGGIVLVPLTMLDLMGAKAHYEPWQDGDIIAIFRDGVPSGVSKRMFYQWSRFGVEHLEPDSWADEAVQDNGWVRVTVTPA